MNGTENNSRLSISPVNRRITFLILGFAFLSFVASLLPLLPGVQEWIPLEILDRPGALTLYSCFLVGYMALLFPISVLSERQEARRKNRSWFWVGGFILAFAGVPLFVHAYIAGVSLKGVILILLWAGFFHGLACLWSQFFAAASRILLVAINFFFILVLPTSHYLGRFFGVDQGFVGPLGAILATTSEFAEANLMLPLALTSLVYGAVWLCGRGPRIKAAATVLVLGSLSPLLAGGPPSDQQPLAAKHKTGAELLIGDYFVPGRLLPLRLDAKPGQTLTVEVAHREEIHWRSEANAARSIWLHLSLTAAGERIRVRVKDGAIVLDVGPKPLPRDRYLILAVDYPPQERPGFEWRRLKARKLFQSSRGYDSFSAVVMPAALKSRLDQNTAAALDFWVADGGHLILVEADQDGLKNRGRGVVEKVRAKDLPVNLKLQSRSLSLHESNLYSSFALPDWGKVDLNGLMLFLGLYHLAFYLGFLLPLFLDARKSQGVYLVSAGFVLCLVIGGAYYVLKSVFLTENQVLQQNLSTWVCAPSEGGGLDLLLHQDSCFASFNGGVEQLEFAIENEPQLVYAQGSRGVGGMTLSGDGQSLAVEGLVLDRFNAKQVLKFSALAPAPFQVEKEGRRVRLRPRPGINDQFGLLRAAKKSAFYRHQGRLYPCKVDREFIEIGTKPAPLAWHGVVPDALRADNGIPFLRYALGRYAPAHQSLLVLLVNGAKTLHPGLGYLQRRDIAQIVVIPLRLR